MITLGIDVGGKTCNREASHHGTWARKPRYSARGNILEHFTTVIGSEL